jgi:hypothetical protein
MEMTEFLREALRLSDGDLEFLIEAASPAVKDKSKLKQILIEDEDFRNEFIGDDKVFRKAMNEQDILVRISPSLFFQILLRHAAGNLKEVSYTLEKTNTMKIPVFDTSEVVELLNQEPFLSYLADMLSSFTKVGSYTISYIGEKGIWRKFRFNDLDIHSLMRFCEAVNDEHRLGFYKRIADICLFILGVFPHYAERDYRYPFSGEVRPALRGKLRMSPEDYEEQGRRFYKLAAKHQAAGGLELSPIFWLLHRNFHQAKKPLNFISDHYLRYMSHKVFL